MSSLFGEVWFWSLLSFLLGALLTWVLLVRPLQQRANHLEQQLHEVARGTQRAQPGQAEPGGRPQQAPEYRQSSSSVFDEPVPPTRRHDWLERDSLSARPRNDDEPDAVDQFVRDEDERERAEYHEYAEEMRGTPTREHDRSAGYAEDDFEPDRPEPFEQEPYRREWSHPHADHEDFDHRGDPADEQPGRFHERAGAAEADPSAADDGEVTRVQPVISAAASDRTPRDVDDEPPGSLFEPDQPAGGSIADRLGGADDTADTSGFAALDDPSEEVERAPSADRDQATGQAQAAEHAAPPVDTWPETPTQIQPRVLGSADIDLAGDQELEEFTRRVPRRSASTPPPVRPQPAPTASAESAAPAAPGRAESASTQAESTGAYAPVSSAQTDAPTEGPAPEQPSAPAAPQQPAGFESTEFETESAAGPAAEPEVPAMFHQPEVAQAEAAAGHQAAETSAAQPETTTGFQPADTSAIRPDAPVAFRPTEAPDVQAPTPSGFSAPAPQAQPGETQLPDAPAEPVSAAPQQGDEWTPDSPESRDSREGAPSGVAASAVGDHGDHGDQPSLFTEPEKPAVAPEVGPDGRLPDIEPQLDPETGLPKRTRGATHQIRGGFEPPKPIKPSMRPVARRVPQANVPSGGSLFEPASSKGAKAQPSGAQLPPPGPFGPGSAMPLPGGGRPGPEYRVKGSVTALRYCPEDSPRFNEMVAEVWFTSVADAERVGFRPLEG
ncbi:MAG: hypothetical protein DIU77_005770 [Thermocrispum agreste]|uniref:Uncharacterized protein n=1 Tax=Thermocrispum agreste TaxID=37925 RepID=A0ABD6FFC1_9PSEU